jgi:hypothetical protein
VRLLGRGLAPPAPAFRATGRRMDPRRTGSGGVKAESTNAPAASAQLPRRTARVLAAADIPPSRLGPTRASRLSESERRLYTWILRSFAAHGRPSNAETRAEARRLGLDDRRALERLAREDLVHLGGDGEIAVAYPFSGRPTAHRVRFPSGHEVYAMCAIDALGTAPMFEQPVAIASRDPVSGEEIGARVAPNLEAAWQPPSTVVVAGALRGNGDSCAACCPVLNFFASSDNAERWLAQHPEISGEVVSMREAILAGRAVFGEVLREP